MGHPVLTKTQLREGVWQGVISGGGGTTPSVEVTHQSVPVPGVELARNEKAGHWLLSIPIPATAIADGVQTLLIRDTTTDMQLGHITLLAGDVLTDDIRAELDLLRAELDLLKRAFRRHCVETD